MNKKALIITIVVFLASASILAALQFLPKTKPVAVTSPATLNTDEARAIKAMAVSYEAKGDLLKARDAYSKILERFPNSPDVEKIQAALDNLNVRILFSPVMTPDSSYYEVAKGDTLNKIAKKFSTTPDLIAKANNLKDQTVRIGKRLKISKSRFGLVVDKSQNIMTLKSDGNIFKTYRVATGKNNSTPAGTFKITNKIVNPPWYPPEGGVIQPGDPRNVLGSRWMGISQQGYGIHGTTDPASIGQSVTEGCVRMKNEEVEELYSIVPEGTEVVIVD